MADILALRASLRAAQAALDVEEQKLSDLEIELDNALGDGLPPSALQYLRKLVLAQAVVTRRARALRDSALAAYQAAVQGDSMHAADPALPLVLLPVRIETAYLTTNGATDLVVRVYPDDIHVDAHEPELSPVELAAGTAYWNAVWGAGQNAVRLTSAWQAVLAQLKPSRAAWAVQALTPATPRPTQETPLDQPQPQPPLPAVATRGGTFNRAAKTSLLPDHWHVIGIRGGAELFNVDASPIPDGLDVSFGPPGTGADVTSDLPFTAASRWLVDLDAAIAVGMAVRIPLSGDLSVDQLFVLGVNAAVPPLDAADRLETTLTAHQYTNGLAFLPPGTPTNNTSATRSAWQSAALPPTPAEVESARAGYQGGSAQNAALVAGALGVNGSQVLCIAPHGLDDQRTPVETLHRQLWPALGGKALSLLYWRWDIPAGGSPYDGGWHLHDNPAATAAIYEHAIGWVKSRGSLPVLRVGRQPYGLLPVSSLSGWSLPAADPTTTIVDWLRTVRPYWLAGLGSVPRIAPGITGDPDTTVVNMLSRLPVSSSLMVRADGDPVSVAVADQPFPPAAVPGLPMNSEMYYATPAASAQRLAVPVVGDAGGDQYVLSVLLRLFTDCLHVLEQDGMTSAQFGAKYTSLFAGNNIDGAPPPDFWISLLSDSFNDPLAASQDQVAAGLLFGALAFDSEKGDPSFLQRVQQFLPSARAFIDQLRATFALGGADPTVYGELLFELLDIYSHRYDAWVTSIFARRLDQLRAAKPAGVVIGAYGWVENLTPRTDLMPVMPPPQGVDSALSSPRQDYIHAPSLHHAATAAVLRAGFDSHRGDALAVNLTSDRVRVADWLAAGVRNGQTVGALLGYRFERGLHEVALDSLIEPLRKQFPLPLPAGDPSDVNDAAARESIGARNVVDGLALVRAYDALSMQFQGQPPVLALLDELVAALDSLGDLLLAESVHHLVGGNPLRAGVSADTLGRGEPVPERFDVVRTPRTGRPLTWQIGVVLPTAWQSPSLGWNNERPRARLEPHANAWAATMLGDAGRYRIACSITDIQGNLSTTMIGLDAMALAPLDVLAEASGDPSLLQRRIVASVAAPLGAGSTVSVPNQPNSDGSLGWVELAGLASRLSSLLAVASPLGPQHLQGPDTSPVLGLDTSELNGRVAAFHVSLAAAVGQLQAITEATSHDENSLQSALLAVADHGLAAAFPASGNDVAGLIAQAATVLATAAGLPAAPPPLPVAGAEPSEVLRWFGAVQDDVRAIAGKMIPLVPSYRWDTASVAATSLAPSNAPVGADTLSIMAWLRRVARVRPNSATLHDILLVAEAIAATPPAWVATQLPIAAGASWIGLPFGAATASKTRLANLMLTPTAIDPAQPLCGLVFDHWTETLPGLAGIAGAQPDQQASEISGVAFTVETPDAYAPQAILIAVAPDPAAGWSLDVLFDVVQETLELAKARAVDLGDLPRLGRVLPLVHSGGNVDSLLATPGALQ